MSRKSHYIPQFILKGFGKHSSVFDIGEQVVCAGIVSNQQYYIEGLYTDAVETLLATDLEQNSRDLIEGLRRIGTGTITASIAGVRRYLAVSYLRTPHMKQALGEDLFEKAIVECVMHGISSHLFDILRHIDGSYVTKELDVLQKGTLVLISTEQSADTFLISDNGPTFLDGGKAIYPISGHAAITIGFGDSIHVDESWVMDINRRIMDGAHDIIGMTSIEDVLRSVCSYRENGLIISDYSAFLKKAESLINGRRFNSPVPNLIVPEEYCRYLGKPAVPEELRSIMDSGDYERYAALIVLDRFGLLGDSRSVDETPFFNLPEDTINGWVFTNLERLGCEFEKCLSVPFLEKSAEYGIGDSCDKLRRYYEKGNHVEADGAKSLYYRDLGCKAGNGDCLVAYYQTLEKDPNYLSKLNLYDMKPLETSGTASFACAKVFCAHGDLVNCLKYVRMSANAGYKGARDILDNPKRMG